MADSKDKKSPIRITPTYFFLLLSLVDGERHGYALAQDVTERSDGSIRLGPGSLYWSLNRLADVGLIAETEGPDPVGPGDERRRYYRLTDTGREVLQREVGTLAKVVDFARAKRVV